MSVNKTKKGLYLNIRFPALPTRPHGIYAVSPK